MRRLAALAALAAPAAALPTLVYVVGVEGSGHHGAMLQLVWPLVRDRCGRACPPPRSRADLDDDGSDAVYARASRCDSYAHDAAVAGALFGDAPDGRVGDPAALRRALAAAPPGAVFVESRSFPAGGAPLRAGPVDARRRPPLPLDLADLAAQLRPVWNSNLQPDFNVRVCERFSSAVLRELAESNRFVQKSAESTSI